MQTGTGHGNPGADDAGRARARPQTGVVATRAETPAATDPQGAGPSPEFLAAFRARAGQGGVLTFAEFMALALYDGRVGYYRRERRRVGRAAGTDFFTASSLGPFFGELVAAAGVTLLGGAEVAARHTFVEIGAEPFDVAGGPLGVAQGRPGGVLAGVAHPFAGARVVRLGEPLALAGPCVVFSNELFDAQPLRRFVRRGRAWRELGVALHGAALAEVELGAAAADWLPADAPEGYVFDAPRAAAELAADIAAQPWHGLFLAFDYGKAFAELATATPAGTARAYHRHTQSNDLLARPGEQDLTGHVCWDWLTDALAAGGFAGATVETQEAFFTRHAGDHIARTLAAEARDPLGPRKRAVMALLHPARMGQKFQALHARRTLPGG
jgi:SAM-dependent MidA family methyltransferase